MDIVLRQRINILIHLAEIESATSSSPEFEMIKRVAKGSNFSQKDLISLVKSPDPIGSFGALSESQKKIYMYNICELMSLIDLNQQKRLFCQELAYNLSYDINQMNVIFEEFRNRSQLQFG